MTILLPLLVCLLGLIVYAMPITSTKILELARISFACGLLVTLFYAATHGVHIQ